MSVDISHKDVAEDSEIGFLTRDGKDKREAKGIRYVAITVEIVARLTTGLLIGSTLEGDSDTSRRLGLER